MSDPRFSRFKSDPRFRKTRKKHNKVLVDERFKSIFVDDKTGAKHKTKTQVDKYGRKLSKTHDTESLKRFYRLEDEEEQLVASSLPDYARGEILMESSEEEEENAEESDQDGDPPVILGRDARKPIFIEEEVEIDLDESHFAELDALAEINVAKLKEEEQVNSTFNAEQTNRLAVVNLDWDHVKANHLFKIFSSAITPSFKKGVQAAPIGKVLHVRIYPSEFGKMRMEREAKEGPPKEIFKTRADDDDIIQEDDGAEYDDDALRKYQLERLRYYYAIVTCDTTETATHIYSELDGTELERSANVFDLSYVPKDMTFGDGYTDEAFEEETSYRAVEFVTDALRHSKVKLTWDVDDPERIKLTRRTFSKKELEEADFKAFLASASSDEGSGEEKDAKARREKVRSLLLDQIDGDNDHLPEGWGKDLDKGSEMEITFTPGLSGSNNNVGPEEETTLQRYVRKQKERRKKRKDERLEKTNNASEDDFFGEDGDGDSEEINDRPTRDNRSKKAGAKTANSAELEWLQTTLGEGQEPNHFDMRAVIKAEKEKARKRRKGKKPTKDQHANETQEEFVPDVNDARFKALHEDHAFAIDPSNPHFKKTKTMSALLEERAKHHRQEQGTGTSPKNLSSNGITNNQGLKNLIESRYQNLSVTVTRMPEHSIDWQQIIAAFSPTSNADNRSRALYELSTHISNTRQKQPNAEEGTRTLIEPFVEILESHLGETNETILTSTLYFLSTLFQLDISSSAEILCRDGILSSVMDIPDLLPSSRTVLHAIAELLSQACSSKQCRSLISSDEVRSWLERNAQQSDDLSLRATSSVALIKLARGLEEDTQIESIKGASSSAGYHNYDVEKLFDSMKKLLLSVSTIPQLSAVLDSVEGLAYLTVRPNFKELLAHDTPSLKQLMNLGRGQTKAAFPASYQQVPPSKTAVEMDLGMSYGIAAITYNLSLYKRRLSEEEQRVEDLRLMTKLPNPSPRSTEKNTPQKADPLEDDDHVRIRCKKLLQAGAVETLGSIIKRTIAKSSAKRNVAIHRTVASALLYLSEDKNDRGKILQGGGVKTLLSIIQASLEEPPDVKEGDSEKKTDILDVADLPAIQALAKLAITSSPTAVFGANLDAYIDAIRPFTILLTHSSSSLLQRFEAIMALTNLASISSEAADRLARFQLGKGLKFTSQLQTSSGIIVQQCEHLLLDDNVMVRRAATELICNLVGGSETAFDYFGGTSESSSKSRLHILIALSDVEDLPTRLAASGGLAVLTASPYACRSLAELELERHRVVPILVGLIAPTIAREYREENENQEDQPETEPEDAGLVHRGVVCIRNIFANLDSKEERRAMSIEGEKRGLVRALVHIVKNTPGGPNNASIIKPAAEVLKWMIGAGIKLPV
ncbi:hypothetical protein Clacol_008149 [Clathrus columnatus]|uniref:Uncharacterized protein n=1 Tax=Clathrus columnatus TaxID=1419009 RepID=A0AAV5AGX1_9AGAM|nr:hypothetical protein Clacol_008149 [Clathrus columnatus]